MTVHFRLYGQEGQRFVHVHFSDGLGLHRHLHELSRIQWSRLVRLHDRAREKARHLACGTRCRVGQVHSIEVVATHDDLLGPCILLLSSVRRDEEQLLISLRAHECRRLDEIFSEVTAWMQNGTCLPAGPAERHEAEE